MSHGSLKAIFLILTIVAVMLVSAVGTTSVLADDGAPPPAPTETEVVEPPAEEPSEVAPTAEPVATEAPATEEPVATEPPAEVAPTEAPLATEAPAEVAPTEAPVVEEAPAEPETILEQLPEDTTITVLNSEGEAQPLTSEDTAEAILTGDPVWCPAGQEPGDSGCTPAFENLSSLLQFLQEHQGEGAYQQDGTIYVEMGSYTGPETDITVDPLDFSTFSNFNLTVQGGWDPSNNSTSSTTEFNIPIAVGTSDDNDWGGSLTFNNISISDVYGQTGLTLFSSGNVTLNEVSVTDSQGGAELDADVDVNIYNSQFDDNQHFGAKVKADRFVTIVGKEGDLTTFDGNGNIGLQINSGSDTFLDFVSASENDGNGANITSEGYVAVLDSVFNGNIAYTHNCPNNYQPSCYTCQERAIGGYGLQITTTSSVYLQNVTANGNFFFGADVDALDAEIYDSSFSNNGSGSLTNPQGYGLNVNTSGGIGVTLANVHADDNQLYGANIAAGSGVVTINDSFFDGNQSYTSCGYSQYSCVQCVQQYYGYGLQVVTTSDVFMNNVSAQDNFLWGAHVTSGFTSIVDSVFSNNGSGSSQHLTGEGLQITSTGEVDLVGVQANNNQKFGAHIETSGTVDVTNSTFSGNIVYTSTYHGPKAVGGGYGLEIHAGDTVQLSGVDASDNWLFGAHITGPDVLIDTSTFNHNKAGLNIESTGNVQISDSSADNNRRSGATINAAGTVTIGYSTFSGNHSYTYVNCQDKDFFGYGLNVVSGDQITLTQVSANDNYLYGASLQGAGVSVNHGSFSSNGTDNPADHIGSGLQINSTGGGRVEINDVTASNNQLFGADITADGFVLVTNSVFSGNRSYTQTQCGCKTYDGYGLKIVTSGDIRLSNVTANDNYTFGTSLTGNNVTVANSQFNANGSPNKQGKGLEIKSSADTLLDNVEASDNQLFGASVTAGGAVTVTNSVFARNLYSLSCSQKGGYGLKVVSTGNISLTNVDANSNGSDGANLTSQQEVRVTDSQFNDNGGNGLTIDARGEVWLTNLQADGNQGNGVKVTGHCTNTVHVVDGSFTNNGRYGIKIVDATYAPVGTQEFLNNGSGNVFQGSSACVTSVPSNSVAAATTTSQTTSSGSNSNPNWWYWWWFWHNSFGHH